MKNSSIISSASRAYEPVKHTAMCKVVEACACAYCMIRERCGLRSALSLQVGGEHRAGESRFETDISLERGREYC